MRWKAKLSFIASKHFLHLQHDFKLSTFKGLYIARKSTEKVAKVFPGQTQSSEIKKSMDHVGL